MIINERISGVLLSVPDNIAAPKSRKAIEHALAAKKAAAKAFAARDAAADVRRRVVEMVATEAGALLDEDPDAEIPDGGAIVAEAQTVLDARQRELEARVEAERRAGIRIREAVAEELRLLGRAAIVDGDVALAMLSATLEDAELARDALWGSIGIGHMVARLTDEPGAPIAIQHKAYGYTFDLEAAIEGLREALVKAAEEHASLKSALKPRKGKRAAAAGTPASEAPVAAPTHSAPTPPAADAALGDLTIGGDDND